MKRFRRGQSTLEYVIVLAAVVGAIIAVASMLKKKLPESYEGLAGKVSDKIETVAF
jgi:Flp pilus assembly pilin Flp